MTATNGESVEAPQTAMLLTEQEWQDLAVMVERSVLTPEQRKWCAAWEHRRPSWTVARRRSDLAQRIIEATHPGRQT